jgi:phage baseplate assembly protein W
MRNTFIGYSTTGGTKADGFKLYDVDLVRQDLYNHFHTRIGERIMRPDFGCRIWDYIMEPFTEEIRNLAEAEVVRICNSDSRVQLIDTQVYSQDNTLIVVATLNYLPFNTVEQFRLNFENRQSTTDSEGF